MQNETFKRHNKIHSTPEKVFAQIDDFSKTGMPMSESSMMMMGGKSKLEQLSLNYSRVGATYRWYGKMISMTMDFNEAVTLWETPQLKEWETVGEAKIFIISWYKMWLEIKPTEMKLLQNVRSAIWHPTNGIIKSLVSFLQTGIAISV